MWSAWYRPTACPFLYFGTAFRSILLMPQSPLSCASRISSQCQQHLLGGAKENRRVKSDNLYPSQTVLLAPLS